MSFPKVVERIYSMAHTDEMTLRIELEVLGKPTDVLISPVNPDLNQPLTLDLLPAQ